MKKYVLLTAVFLGAASFSNIAIAQMDPVTSPDVPELLYDVEEALTMQEALITARHKLLLETQKRFFNNPTEKNFEHLVDAAQKDIAAVNKYSETLDAKGVKAAEREYYEETPATKAEFEKGPPPPPPPPGGHFPQYEGLAQEEGMTKEQIEARLKEEIHQKKSFADELREQQAKLKNVQSEIEEQKKLPTANQQQMNSLENILKKAMAARRKAIEGQEESSKKLKQPTKPITRPGAPAAPARLR